MVTSATADCSVQNSLPRSDKKLLEISVCNISETARSYGNRLDPYTISRGLKLPNRGLNAVIYLKT